MKRRRLADDPRAEKACSEVQESFSNYQRAANNDTKQTLQRTKEGLKQVYQEIQEEELDEMISQVENADAESKHRESGRPINSITGHKAAKQRVIKGKSKDERI
ncbi:Hypothetical predicted protein [Octopus vulgaris]|uniref:Uncharacterized protein n=1 Tax=Octopus vulgaris TaxID=6645 RepID=A0AA36FPX8_OCTVU|nr:Hypothetical predicted protein [Octopus vulgaris]